MTDNFIFNKNLNDTFYPDYNHGINWFSFLKTTKSNLSKLSFSIYINSENKGFLSELFTFFF